MTDLKSINAFWSAALRGFNLLIAIICLLTAYGGMISPTVSVIPSLATMLFPVMMAVVAVVFVIDLFISVRVSLIMVVTTGLCAGPFLSFCPLNFGNESNAASIPSDRRLTVLTYNVLNLVDAGNPTAPKNEASGALSYIIGSDADIVCLQECSPLTVKGNTGVRRSQIDSIRREYPYRIESSDMLAVLSRTPLEKVPFDFTPAFSYEAACYRTTVDGNAMYIVNLHLQSIGLNSEDKELYRELTKGDAKKSDIHDIRANLLHKLAEAFRKRAGQAQEVRKFINTLNGDVIVCGDFNDVPGCYAIRTIAGHDFHDAYADGALGPCWTYNRDRFLFRIDHILYRGDIKAISTVRGNDRSSDHYPLMTTFEFTDKQ